MQARRGCKGRTFLCILPVIGATRRRQLTAYLSNLREAVFAGLVEHRIVSLSIHLGQLRLLPVHCAAVSSSRPHCHTIHTGDVFVVVLGPRAGERRVRLAAMLVSLR